MKVFIATLTILLLAGCLSSNGGAPATTAPALTPQVVSVYATAVTLPWLDNVYECAKRQRVIIRLATSKDAADIRLQFGEPENLTVPAYLIDSEDLLIVTHHESPIQNLTADEARALFSQGQENIQIWVFASGEDVQRVFEREIMRGMRINSLARLAASPRQMSEALKADKNAVGILPGNWKAGNMREVYTLPDLPVLALTPVELQGIVKEMLACLTNQTR